MLISKLFEKLQKIKKSSVKSMESRAIFNVILLIYQCFWHSLFGKTLFLITLSKVLNSVQEFTIYSYVSNNTNIFCIVTDTSKAQKWLKKRINAFHKYLTFPFLPQCFPFPDKRSKSLQLNLLKIFLHCHFHQAL
jgi:hypothetical protein